MKRLLVLVEGQTEERFIKQVLQPHLWRYQVSIEPKIVMTKRVIGAAAHKGGGDYSKVRADLKRLLGDSNAVAVTTLFDFYGFPGQVPGTDAQTYSSIEALTDAINRDVGDARFSAYLQRHEFEAFLFVDSWVTAQVAQQSDKQPAIEAQRKSFTTVEDINLNPQFAPSKRLTAILGRYSKPLTGAVVAQQIGMDRLRAECPRFSLWVAWLESFGQKT